MRRLALGVAPAALVTIIVLAFGGHGRIDKPAPALPTAVLSGGTVTLASLHGKPAIIHFWASWCGPCRKEAPQLARLSTELRNHATLVGIDYSDDAASARRFAFKHHWAFPQLEDPIGVFGDRYAIGGLPTTFVLDARGRIVAQLAGAQTASKLLADLASDT